MPAPGTQGTSLDATRFGVYGTPAAGVPLEKVEAALDDDDRDVPRQGPDGGRTRALQEPHDRRLRLRAGQSGDARAHVWRGAHHRLDRRGRAGAARSGCAPSPPSRCAMPRGAISTSAIRSPAIWSAKARRARRRNREQDLRRAAAGVALGFAALARRDAREQDRADRQPRRHQGLAGARAGRADDRARLRLHRRRQRRSGRQARASPT